MSGHIVRAQHSKESSHSAREERRRQLELVRQAKGILEARENELMLSSSEDSSGGNNKNIKTNSSSRNRNKEPPTSKSKSPKARPAAPPDTWGPVRSRVSGRMGSKERVGLRDRDRGPRDAGPPTALTSRGAAAGRRRSRSRSRGDRNVDTRRSRNYLSTRPAEVPRRGGPARGPPERTTRTSRERGRNKDSGRGAAPPPAKNAPRRSRSRSKRGRDGQNGQDDRRDEPRRAAGGTEKRDPAKKKDLPEIERPGTTTTVDGRRKGGRKRSSSSEQRAVNKVKDSRKQDENKVVRNRGKGEQEPPLSPPRRPDTTTRAGDHRDEQRKTQKEATRRQVVSSRDRAQQTRGKQDSKRDIITGRNKPDGVQRDERARTEKDRGKEKGTIERASGRVDHGAEDVVRRAARSRSPISRRDVAKGKDTRASQRRRADDENNNNKARVDNKTATTENENRDPPQRNRRSPVKPSPEEEQLDNKKNKTTTTGSRRMDDKIAAKIATKKQQESSSSSDESSSSDSEDNSSSSSSPSARRTKQKKEPASVDEQNGNKKDAKMRAADGSARNNNSRNNREQRQVAGAKTTVRRENLSENKPRPRKDETREDENNALYSRGRRGRRSSSRDRKNTRNKVLAPTSSLQIKANHDDPPREEVGDAPRQNDTVLNQQNIKKADLRRPRRSRNQSRSRSRERQSDKVDVVLAKRTTTAGATISLKPAAAAGKDEVVHQQRRRISNSRARRSVDWRFAEEDHASNRIVVAGDDDRRNYNRRTSDREVERAGLQHVELKRPGSTTGAVDLRKKNPTTQLISKREELQLRRDDGHESVIVLRSKKSAERDPISTKKNAGKLVPASSASAAVVLLPRSKSNPPPSPSLFNSRGDFDPPSRTPAAKIKKPKLVARKDVAAVRENETESRNKPSLILKQWSKDSRDWEENEWQKPDSPRGGPRQKPDHSLDAVPPPGEQLFSVKISNITQHVTDFGIERVFSQFGKVRDVYIPKVFKTGRNKSFAFVRFAKKKEAEKAVRQTGTVVLDNVKVDLCVAKFGRQDGTVNDVVPGEEYDYGAGAPPESWQQQEGYWEDEDWDDDEMEYADWDESEMRRWRTRTRRERRERKALREQTESEEVWGTKNKKSKPLKNNAAQRNNKKGARNNIPPGAQNYSDNEEFAEEQVKRERREKRFGAPGAAVVDITAKYVGRNTNRPPAASSSSGSRGENQNYSREDEMNPQQSIPSHDENDEDEGFISNFDDHLPPSDLPLAY
ncbi:unnamed protein product [Amoebophrya sp. A120]|nr:unnamed protein product [Amoebophrya sp. A120]|eukprot:GSA120T00016959001.1